MVGFSSLRPILLHESLTLTALATPDGQLIVSPQGSAYTASEVARLAENLSGVLQHIGLTRDQRCAVYLPKTILAATAVYAIAAAGAVIVPINPLLKAQQVQHILDDCSASILITSAERVASLQSIIGSCSALRHILIEPSEERSVPFGIPATALPEAFDAGLPYKSCARTDSDMAAILYTSGSTGRPKGVVLSHRNLLEGAGCVAEYLQIRAHDRLLAVLPFSFDYGLNQLTSAVLRGATCVLHDFLFGRDVVNAIEKNAITGLAGVPTLWARLAELDWPARARSSLRYMTNSGGALPSGLQARLRAKLPTTRLYLMYGLTEAFRSTYLPPELLDAKPGSIGKAIPNQEIFVVRNDGSLCAPDEPGELVHRGSLVSMGYWNDPESTHQRFKPAPGKPAALPLEELAVWSGDTVRVDADGYLFFVARNDAMIKTSGYRVSPEEIEEVVCSLATVRQAAAIGVPDAELGHRVVVLVEPESDQNVDVDGIRQHCRRVLPAFMVPSEIIALKALPLNPNGKVDRQTLTLQFSHPDEIQSSTQAGDV